MSSCAFIAIKISKSQTSKNIYKTKVYNIKVQGIAKFFQNGVDLKVFQNANKFWRKSCQCVERALLWHIEWDAKNKSYQQKFK